MEPSNISEDAVELMLAPVLDMRAAMSLHRDLLDRRGASIIVDASAVERIGGQCAAILMSAHKSWASDGHAMQLVRSSPGFADGLRLLGIDPARIGADSTATSDASAD